MKKTAIFLGHPNSESYCGALAKAYEEGVKESGGEVRFFSLGDMEFDTILHKGYDEIPKPEKDLEEMQDAILWAEHLVFVYPIWWSTTPALLKGFIERAFLPDFAYRFIKGKKLPQGLLKGKSARIIVTMDTPSFIYKYFLHEPNTNMIKKGVLNFCGVKKVKITQLSPVRSSDDSRRKRWISDVKKMGNNTI